MFLKNILAVTVLFFSVTFMGSAQAYDKPIVRIYIENKSPLGMELFEWRDSVLAAAKEWFEPSGLLIKVVSSRVSADIVVVAAHPRTDKHNGYYGYTFPPKTFPNIPHSNNRSAIVIHKMINTMKNGNLMRTLRHEFGHVVGLRHKEGSVVSEVWPRSNTLTEYDLEKLQELKKAVTKYAADLDRKKKLTQNAQNYPNL